MKKTLVMLAFAVVLAGAALGDATKVRVLCGASMAEPVKKVADAFERDTGLGVELTLGGCETLFPQMELGFPADVFVGHAPFAEKLAEKGLRQPRLVILGALRPTLVVAKGNPKAIRGVADLGREGLRVGMPDARYSTCGEMFEKGAGDAGLLAAIQARTVYTSRAHQELATALLTGNVDAVIVWNFVAAMHKDALDEIPMEMDFPSASVFAAALAKPTNPDGAVAFLDYIERTESRAVFGAMGYGTALAAVTPGKLLVYCAGGVKKPIDELAQRFQAQCPGAEFEMMYQGSGALLAQIELAKVGDLYIAGDDFFMKTAQDKGLVTEAEQMAVFTPVLAVPKGNPAGLTGFQDLAKAGVRVGMGDEKITAVGHACRAYLDRLGIRAHVEKNVIVSGSTVDQLAVQCASGHLDAAIIWDATAWQFGDRLDVVAKGDAESSVGVPIGILAVSKNPACARAFIDMTIAPEAAAVFEKYGIVSASTPRGQ
ncbi:MAG TPA: molybdate ABC transporter substrate-binding protein [Candidatus Hydrogenedentes bacterium]|nr:molybdate ABC transporter substrate-binding protein [Candidatus Hydrogenedentota bacterium]HPG67582.1 molybdate ABC transporter substrate-binding protein [Candidatus Hydrogenedentota bacterium]